MARYRDTVRGGIGLPCGPPKQLTANKTRKNCKPERRCWEAWDTWNQLVTLTERLSSGMFEAPPMRGMPDEYLREGSPDDE